MLFDMFSKCVKFSDIEPAFKCRRISIKRKIMIFLDVCEVIVSDSCFNNEVGYYNLYGIEIRIVDV
ncbi:hypothetical protein HOLleu_33103 [Holothuria leucospilota]|uniref:Uncharacterized protein n=1 Tax=Holothuria leucospilota TaxID=206669 RepID=A0A9Q1BF67_HOLLE|nr:hypothetical protein HOLleu_33103 [Holothuria leucospilota]